MDRGTSWTTVHRVTKSQTRLRDYSIFNGDRLKLKIFFFFTMKREQKAEESRKYAF